MKIADYNIIKEAFENNLGAFFVAEDPKGGKCLLLKINKTLKDEKFLNQVKDFAKSNTVSINNVIFMKDMFPFEDEYYGVYDYIPGKPLSFTMSQNRKSKQLNEIIKTVAIALDSIYNAGLTYGGLTTETIVTSESSLNLIGIEFYNTEYKLAGNEDLYSLGYTDPKVTDYKYNQKSDVYSLGRLVGTLFLAEKFYTTQAYPIPNISQLKPIQASINQACGDDERFNTCEDFANSLVEFKGTCPFTDHGSQYATYAYVIVVIILVIIDIIVTNNGGSLGG